MGKKHEQDLRIVEGVVSAQLAERDAEIARLGTEVEDMVGQIAYLNRQLNEANQIVRAGEAERKALAAQVSALQAWKDAVPVDALRWYFLNSYTSDATYSAHRAEMHSKQIGDWLFPVEVDD